ncbi:hypothetical protein ASPVEDRAFT_89562 [Aspergillus versicolor CBS 583.65]|uniref:Aldehyde dehydrogenase domain-containing protein n=1 Tax=Aspergillus versicolor CBS 583.65 TaxID=1036611 RepID=A0A1L9Q3L8_ASPVE|nr:uncharacterized protein ASPVEDRAFT_89562 [Aspergillus versicolor CBS 583.65]OJJ08336.1 hypothetical protein ASPVEDRAFT_89562 [Aspergillus versicolor CBS 583.65]
MSAPERSRVEIGAIEGRARNLRGRQQELRSLFAHLTAHSDKFVQAIRTEEACLLHEAEVAVAAMLLDLRKHYERLDLKTELATEYKSKRGQSCPERRVAARIVYIIPETAFLAFSVFSALCAAIEAGSCCVVELPTTAQKSAQLVRQAITESLDKETFAVVSRRAPPDFLARCLVVDQLGRLGSTDDVLGRVVSAPAARAVALVDRTADAKLAAREVVASRLAFGGRSHCAVDQVFVNEFVADDFLDAVAHELSQYEQARVLDSKAVEKNRMSQSRRSARMEKTSEMQDAENGVNQGTCKSVWRGQLGLAVEVVDRSSRLLKCKTRAPLIAIHRVTSLDDAIDLCATEEEELGPIYVFAAGPEANYLSKFVESTAAFLNHIPAQLLIGPSFPVGYPVQLDLRFTRDMFEHPSPEIAPGERFHAISWTLFYGESPVGAKMLATMSKPLNPTGQAPAGAWGFFDQGIILGAVVYLLPLVAASVAGTAYMGVLGYRYLT